MVYLRSFSLPSARAENAYFDPNNPAFSTKNYRTINTSIYPFGVFGFRKMPEEFEFGEITIFCGNNGSGKSTILNVIAEKLRVARTSVYNRTDFFDDYADLCRFTTFGTIPRISRIITSDDVFDKVLDIRRINDGIESKRTELIKEFISIRKDGDPCLHGLDDYDRWKNTIEVQRKSASQSEYIRPRVMQMINEKSNGESALAFFVDAIKDGALYLLDEPENSLSPSNQLELKYFLEDCARSHGCQFIISTHSPFILSLRHAKIYDIDTAPPTVCPWTELDCVKVYHDFFLENDNMFK